MKWLTDNPNRRLIIFWYAKEPIGELSIFKKISAIDSVKNKMLKYSDSDLVKKSSIKNRIHVIIKTERVLQLSLNTTPSIMPIEEGV